MIQTAHKTRVNQGEPGMQMPSIERLHARVYGAVQGVGFRPYVFRLACDIGLTGWVLNGPWGVDLEVEGEPPAIARFMSRFEIEKPPASWIQSVETHRLAPAGYASFDILPSVEEGKKRAIILPDLAPCPECLRELFDKSDRRYRYPFLNCTNCGPRYSIILRLPYDRPNTTMSGFSMCQRCQAEYDTPTDRRFHAQPTACPVCGPQLELLDESGAPHQFGEDALHLAEEALRDGKIVAIKGLGGFQLLVDARNSAAVHRLRERKRREIKPFALMAVDLEQVKAYCDVLDASARILSSPQAPIVLLDSASRNDLSPLVAPGQPALGFMLPGTPLHHILMRDLGFPVVATSGNLSDEPICISGDEARDRLSGIADLILSHNRPIVRPVDDSVARVVLGRETVLRRARGYAPLPITIKSDLPPMLALGAHLKNTVAVNCGKDVFVSQHIGDLETAEAYRSFERCATDLPALYDVHPEAVLCDLHPDYLSTRHALRQGVPVTKVQHHAAHVLACLAENGVDEPALGIAWDGVGYGPDGSVWGGEFFTVDPGSVHRCATFRQFRLPGGDKAVREPRRSAVGLLFAALGEDAFDRTQIPSIAAFQPRELSAIRTMLLKGLNSPLCSSAGRLFDAVASILGISQIMRFEGQAAMALENIASTAEVSPYSINWQRDPLRSVHVLDWEPMILELLEEARSHGDTGVIAARFHETLAQAILHAARHAKLRHVALSGGCFLNRKLLTRAVTLLHADGFEPCWHQRMPPGDGSIALGQVAAYGKEID